MYRFGCVDWWVSCIFHWICCCVYHTKDLHPISIVLSYNSIYIVFFYPNSATLSFPTIMYSIMMQQTFCASRERLRGYRYTTFVRQKRMRSLDVGSYDTVLLSYHIYNKEIVMMRELPDQVAVTSRLCISFVITSVKRK